MVVTSASGMMLYITPCAVISSYCTSSIQEACNSVGVWSFATFTNNNRRRKMSQAIAEEDYTAMVDANLSAELQFTCLTTVYSVKDAF